MLGIIYLYFRKLNCCSDAVRSTFARLPCLYAPPCVFMGRAFAGFWGINITQWIKAPLPWPIQEGLLLKHVLLLSVFCCGVQQFSGQMWRIFAKGMSGQVDPSIPDHLLHWGRRIIHVLAARAA